MKTLWIVVPCYNEEDMLPNIYMDFIKELHILKRRKLISDKSLILFVDDGSTDSTWKYIKQLTEQYEEIEGLKLKNNSGQMHALLAGLMTAKKHHASAVITLDCDGQDDITLMEQMVEKYLEGNDIVYAVRNNRDSDSWFKRTTAQLYYRIFRIFNKSLIYNHAEYRLMSNRILYYLDAHGEDKPFIRKICGAITYYDKVPSAYVYYSRHERIAGKTHYSLKSMLKLALSSLRPVTHETGHVSHKKQYQIETCTLEPIILQNSIDISIYT